MTEMIVGASLLLLAGIILLVLFGACVENDPNAAVVLLLFGVILCIFAIGLLALTPKKYYERKIPTLNEQILQYDKEQIEIKLKEIKGE